MWEILFFHLQSIEQEIYHLKYNDIHKSGQKRNKHQQEVISFSYVLAFLS